MERKLDQMIPIIPLYPSDAQRFWATSSRQLLLVKCAENFGHPKSLRSRRFQLWGLQFVARAACGRGIHGTRASGGWIGGDMWWKRMVQCSCSLLGVWKSVMKIQVAFQISFERSFGLYNCDNLVDILWWEPSIECIDKDGSAKTGTV